MNSRLFLDRVSEALICPNSELIYRFKDLPIHCICEKMKKNEEILAKKNFWYFPWDLVVSDGVGVIYLIIDAGKKLDDNYECAVLYCLRLFLSYTVKYKLDEGCCCDKQKQQENEVSEDLYLANDIIRSIKANIMPV